MSLKIATLQKTQPSRYRSARPGIVDMLKHHLLRALVLAGATGLTACSPVPRGYVSSPVLADHAAALMPDARDNSIHTVSLCQDSLTTDWYASVLFSDGMTYDYALNGAAGTADSVNFYASWSSRKAHYANIDPIFGCLGSTGTNYEFFALGTYRVTFSFLGVGGVVLERVAERAQFDDSVKALLQAAAVAAQDAVQQRKAYVPTSSSWGAETCKYMPVPGTWEKPCHL